MLGLFDGSQWLVYFPEHMDTQRALWFVQDALDVNALRDNAVALAVGAGFQDFKTCEAFLSAFPAVFIALADREFVEVVSDALAEFVPSVPVLLPAEQAFRDHANIREVLAAGGREAVDRLLIGAGASRRRSPGPGRRGAEKPGGYALGTVRHSGAGSGDWRFLSWRAFRVDREA